MDTISAILDNTVVATKLARGERDRIMALAMQYAPQAGAQPISRRPAGFRHNLRPPSGAQPTLPGAQPTSPPANSCGDAANVTWVHQIYGCFRDGKPMNARFVESKRRWEGVAASMGARYHLWTADQVDTLVKTTCGFLWDSYVNCRYPVMRADIGRVAILYSYGGLYSDLDVFPNRASYRQVPFAVCMRPHRSKKPGAQPTFLDMEVLVASINHPLLWGWLAYMQKEIRRKQYARGFWRKARMRYIWHTTGPYAMQRFLRLPANSEWGTTVSYVLCSAAEEGDNATTRDLQKYDVVSPTSNTYFTSKHRIKVAVAAENVPLPERCVPRRRARKLPPEWDQAPSQPSKVYQAPSQPGIEDALAEAHDAAVDLVACAQSAAASEEAAAARRERDVAAEEAAAARRDRGGAAQELAVVRRERDAAAEEAAAARRDRDGAAQELANMRKEKDMVWEQWFDAERRADTWAAMALYLQDSTVGTVFLQSCPPALKQEVRNPTEAVRKLADGFHLAPPDYVGTQQPTAGAQPTPTAGAQRRP